MNLIACKLYIPSDKVNNEELTCRLGNYKHSNLEEIIRIHFVIKMLNFVNCPELISIIFKGEKL